MTKVIDDHGGVVLEFIGDAIFCIFGAPLVNPDHPQAACKAALRMLAALRRMNEWSVSRELPEVQIRCGVHTGRVLVGNMGFQSRMKYGAVGEDSYIPSQLEEINKTYETKMMISHATWKSLEPAQGFITRPVDYVQLGQTAGRPSEPIFQVIERESNPNRVSHYREPANIHAEAMELYRNRKFEAASKKFVKVNSIMWDLRALEDGPSQLMINRCATYMAHPPPDDWDGVWKEGG